MPFGVEQDERGDVRRVWAEVATGRYAGIYDVEFTWPDDDGEPYWQVIRSVADHFSSVTGKPMRWRPTAEWRIPASAAITPAAGRMTYAELWKRLRMPGEPSDEAGRKEIVAWREDGLTYELAGIMGWRMARGVARRFA